jgi:hypothetical protein
MNLAKIAVLLVLATASPAGASPFLDGEPVPRLRLPSIADGTPVSLADFRGEKLLYPGVLGARKGRRLRAVRSLSLWKQREGWSALTAVYRRRL